MSVKDYSTTASSNATVNGVNVAEGCAPSDVNNAMRAIMADIRSEVANKGTDIASTSSIDLGAATGDFVDVTGTTTITALGTVSAGIRRTVRFTGALTLTHNATSLILPGGANITTASGDVARFRSLGSGNWVCEGYSRASGSSVVPVDTAHIADGAVTFAKMAADAQLPAGMIAPYAMSTAPTGWLECDGAAVSRETYADLFAAIGTTFGEGDGTTTFDLPDLRGEFIRGWDNGRGVDSGRAFGSAQLDALQNITGSAAGLISGTSLTKGYFTSASGAFGLAGDSTVDPVADDGTGSGHRKGIDFDASRVARTAAETRPRNIALMYCIKT